GDGDARGLGLVQLHHAAARARDGGDAACEGDGGRGAEVGRRAGLVGDGRLGAGGRVGGAAEGEALVAGVRGRGVEVGVLGGEGEVVGGARRRRRGGRGEGEARGGRGGDGDREAGAVRERAVRDRDAR